MWDDSGYSRDDPKHPDYHDAYSYVADVMKKRAREDGPTTSQLRARVVAETFREGACVDPCDECKCEDAA